MIYNTHSIYTYTQIYIYIYIYYRAARKTKHKQTKDERAMERFLVADLFK